MIKTPIEKLNEDINNNKFYIKREDLIGFSFGGNKARKAEKFKEQIIKNNYDTIVTYGSSSSNHCRIISNMAFSLGKKCYIISPIENYKDTFNSRIIKQFNSIIIKVPVNQVSETIDKLIEKLKTTEKTYFIPGGGHGDLGTMAYVEAYDEINDYEINNNFNFDYIFFASGTGTTHAGLVCGQIIREDFNKKIIGISIARKSEYGKSVVIDSMNSYLKTNTDKYNELVHFVDDYIGDGYGSYNNEILDVIKTVLSKEGIALNTTYTGKAYYGMLDYINKNNIKNKNILFINTGGLPLFFDDMEEL